MRKPPGIPNELFKYEREKRNWTQKDVADKIGPPVDERMIRRWESGKAGPTPHYRSKLAEVFGKSAQALGFPPDGHISFWRVPYRRNAFFTGREDTLQLLHDTFLAQHASPISRLPLALSGLGGVGKTQIALEYAYHYREHYHTVLWLHAASHQDLVADVTAVADLLDLPRKDEANLDQLIESLKAWLTQLTRWLLIFDNVENLELLEGFLPAEITGRVLLTTRSQSLGTHAQYSAVEPMDSSIGAELLLRRAKLLANENVLEHTAEADVARARSLSEDMGGLPLALDQAGAYIEEAKVSLTDYAQLYRDQRGLLLSKRRLLKSKPNEHPESVAATFELSFQAACEGYPVADYILRFCAFLHPDAIPEELFQYDESFMPDPVEFDEAIAALLQYSLIKRDIQEKTFSIHRLVQAVLVDDMPADLQKQWRERMVLALNAAFSEIEFTYGLELMQCERLLPHALVCASWSEDELTPALEVAELLYKVSFYLHARNKFSGESETLLERVFLFYKQHFEASYPDIAAAVAFALFNLAVHYHTQGIHVLTTEPILAINDIQLVAEYPDTIKRLYKQAVLYMQQVEYIRAVPLLKRVLSFQERQYGTEHLDTAKCLYMLAVLYYELNKVWHAEQMFQKSLTIFENHLDAEHPAIALPLCGLARLMYDQEKYEQAEALFQRVLNIRKQHLGERHPYTQRIKEDHANLLRSSGRHAEAADLEAKNELPE